MEKSVRTCFFFFFFLFFSFFFFQPFSSILFREKTQPNKPNHPTHSYRPVLATRLLRAIRNMIPLDATPRHFFYFNGSPTSCLSLPPILKWPTKGYVFFVLQVGGGTRSAPSSAGHIVKRPGSLGLWNVYMYFFIFEV